MEKRHWSALCWHNSNLFIVVLNRNIVSTMANYKLLEAERDKSFILPYLCLAFNRTSSVLSKCLIHGLFGKLALIWDLIVLTFDVCIFRVFFFLSFQLICRGCRLKKKICLTCFWPKMSCFDYWFSPFLTDSVSQFLGYPCTKPELWHPAECHQ